MTQRQDGGMGQPAASGAPTSAPAAADTSAWAPLRQRAFRWLWLGMLISWTGTWMLNAGAQWLVVDAPNAAALVSLVQAASTLPVMLLALPRGVLADSFDRRWLLVTVQAYVFIVGILLAVLTAAGQMPPALLLAFTFALAAGLALRLPAWGATIPELVPRTQLRAASRLDLVSVNVSMAIGPALAGLVIAHLGGVPVVFALNALSVVFLAIALLTWRRPQAGAGSGRERFVPALRAGGRYVWHDPVVRRILLRAVIFVAPATALWARLPGIATQRFGLGAHGFRARGLAIYMITFAGSQAAGALIWGLIANQVGLQPTVLLAAAVLLAGVIAGMAWRVPETGHLDPQPANIYWVDPRLAFDPEPETGPVVVRVEFTVAPERQAALLGGEGPLSPSRPPARA